MPKTNSKPILVTARCPCSQKSSGVYLQKRDDKTKIAGFAKSLMSKAITFFVNDLGELIKPNFVTQHFAILLQNKGLRKILYHDLRHSCATLMLANGVDIKSIRMWMGHSNFSTTADLYAHTDSSKLRSAGMIEQALCRNPAKEKTPQPE